MAPTNTPAKASKPENPTEPASVVQSRISEEADPESNETEPFCVRCERTGTVLDRDAHVDGALSCSIHDRDSWDSCRQIFGPHCPPWCAIDHIGKDGNAIKEGMWFHCSEGLDMVVKSNDGARASNTVHVDVCACEHIGEGIESVDIFLDNTIMTSTQAEHLASVLNATVLLASMSRPASDNK